MLSIKSDFQCTIIIIILSIIHSAKQAKKRRKKIVFLLCRVSIDPKDIFTFLNILHFHFHFFIFKTIEFATYKWNDIRKANKYIEQ